MTNGNKKYTLLLLTGRRVYIISNLYYYNG
nr:MAG TPA: hypothetical protein [Caudoviricetes sp.]